MQRERPPYRIGHGGYVSEFTDFMDDYLRTHPDVQQDQRRAWYIFWDRKVDLKEQRKAELDAAPLPPYHYY